MKYLIIIVIFVVLYFLIIQENFDVSANLNLLTNSEMRFDKPVRIPVSPNIVDDREVPSQVLFNEKINMTILQKLKAINNILERIKDISITESNSKKLDGNVFSNVVIFNPALLPVKTYEPDNQKLSVLTKMIVNQLSFYSGGQYKLNIMNVEDAYAAETDDQYRIAYVIYGTINDIKLKILVDLIIIKSITTDTDLKIVFSELRIDNPNVYITPYNDAENDKYVSIDEYSKSLK
jgi:hypothetical protein